MEGKKSLLRVVRTPSGRGTGRRINQMHFILTGPPPLRRRCAATSGPHFYICIGGRGGVGGAGAVNWSPFDMSGLEVRYPMPFFY